MTTITIQIDIDTECACDNTVCVDSSENNLECFCGTETSNIIADAFNVNIQICDMNCTSVPDIDSASFL